MRMISLAPPSTIRASVGATRIQQLSHQTLNSPLEIPTFSTYIVTPGFVWHGLPLKSRNGRSGVIRLMSAIVQRTGQNKLSGRQRLTFSHALAMVECEQNW